MTIIRRVRKWTSGHLRWMRYRAVIVKDVSPYDYTGYLYLLRKHLVEMTIIKEIILNTEEGKFKCEAWNHDNDARDTCLHAISLLDDVLMYDSLDFPDEITYNETGNMSLDDGQEEAFEKFCNHLRQHGTKWWI